MPFSVFDYQIEKLEEIRDTTQINFLVKAINDNLAVAIAYEIFKNLDKYLKIKRVYAQKMIKQLKNLPGIFLPPAFFNSKIEPSWYGFVFQYKSEELENLSIEKFFEALQAEGLSEIDRPGSTCPLNLLPLFQNPDNLFPSIKNILFLIKLVISQRQKSFIRTQLNYLYGHFKMI